MILQQLYFELIHLRFSLSLWTMAYGHTFGLPPQKAPAMIAEKRELFFVYAFSSCNLSWDTYA